MADGSVAPKERINIAYKSNTGGVSVDVELPLKLLVLDDFTGREDEDVAMDTFDLAVKGVSDSVVVC